MTTSKHPKDQTDFFDCYNGEHLIGHIVKENGRFAAHSWPDYKPLGCYPTREEALTAITDVAYGRWDNVEDWDNIGIQPCPASRNSSNISDRIDEMMEFFRTAEFGRIYFFLRDYGFYPGECKSLLLAALRKAAEINLVETLEDKEDVVEGAL